MSKPFFVHFIVFRVLFFNKTVTREFLMSGAVQQSGASVSTLLEPLLTVLILITEIKMINDCDLATMSRGIRIYWRHRCAPICHSDKRLYGDAMIAL